MIYFSYGMTKSASSFVYQLQERIIELSDYDLVKLPENIRGNKAKENYIEVITNENVEKILAWLPENAATIIKTHSGPSDLAVELVRSKQALASATYRDPREIAVSLLDHGKRSRDKGIKDFANFYSPLDTVNGINTQIHQRFGPWKNAENCLTINYSLTKSSPKELVELLIKQMGVNNVNVEDVLAPFEDKSKIIHYNVGESNRYLNRFNNEELESFNTKFESFIKYCNS
ncbi:TPA: hypothetical protein NJ263_004532 [Vibrio parahaemolyticus]|nr:hypothetical protein [Vibrio parahaemolyticus]